MPVIEYKCECGEQKQEFFWPSEAVPESMLCRCGKPAHRVISSFAFQIHGSYRWEMNPAEEARQCGVDYE